MSSSIAVDVGGTFTDLIHRDEGGGRVQVAKRPTIPDAPDEGVLRTLIEALEPGEIEAADYFLHGTTVGLNALLEGRGARVGLLATRGFRDVLEIRRGDRDDPYDLFWTPPAPMVARHLRLPVSGRIRADGSEHEPLHGDDVRVALAELSSDGVTAIAVAFINAYANPAHELEAERLLRAAGFDGHISLSHRVSGEYREYERTTTTVIDAFVRDRMNSYLARLQSGLRGHGFDGRCLIMRSGGGAMTFDEATERSVETILSGP
ncbi:MAG TPA: hydantoinase/oxoprolinase family protein, partial [Solirubrobacteraceae bacterium]|nr:hydantoinase/oxoprolinase family protein [Solirubrobacteraceae bacterium]